MVWLRSFERNLPPGQFWYQQGSKKFGSSPEIRSVAERVRNFRKANNLPRASINEALEDIVTFTCNRIGQNPTWCYDTNDPLGVLVSQAASSPCASCGAQIT